MDQWPSGSRDTTEFPSQLVNIDKDFRKHLDYFCHLNGCSWDDYAEQRTQLGKNSTELTDQRLRTYRKLYQNLGFIYRESGKIRSSHLAQSLCSLPDELLSILDSETKKIAEISIQILSRYQIDNPTESQRNALPPNCDVQPLVCIWRAMLELDNKIHYEEMNRVILHIMRMEDLPEAINKIGLARQKLLPYSSAESSDLVTYLGEPVHETQTTARIAPWYSFGGWGGLLIGKQNDSDGFRNLVTEHIPIIQKAVDNPPSFYDAQTEQEWNSYYIGSATQQEIQEPASPVDITDIYTSFHQDLGKANIKVDEELPRNFIASCLTKRFVLLTGLSGSGKTKIAQAFAKWLSPSSSTDKLKGKTYEIIAVGADWDNNENLFGYPDALRSEEKAYHKPTNGALDLILRALRPENKDIPFFLILDEMNLSHVERYFADMLSAIESQECIDLHPGDEHALWGEDKDIPGKLKLPPNLVVIGTVNIDETTYMFSPKVLDRANVIEFRISVSDMNNFLNEPSSIDLTKLDGCGSQYCSSFVNSTNLKNVNASTLAVNKTDGTMRLVADGSITTDEISVMDKLKDDLLSLFESLEEAGSEFGYRSAHEIQRFFYYYTLISSNSPEYSKALDSQIMQKLLPKLNGSVRVLGPVLDRLESYSSKEEKNLPIAHRKIGRMKRNLENNGFTSFAEA